ncbi:Molybdopterin molybdenumtransferase [hydrothermal vent metagenome]|uniref:molybdopterin molybdotransferase n=1 Tax=hydrothermal vent metagenome TaxID=652676 RepID=A0A3B0RI15_9ZZZZ
MKPLAQAQVEILAGVPGLGTEEVPVAEALSRVMAEPAVATGPVPPFPNSAMDGYAVRAGDLSSVPVTLPVNEDVAAGSVPTLDVVPGTATRIMTGAPMPGGADAVVPVEDTESADRSTVIINASVGEGTHVRPAGGDVAPGDVVVEAGVRLTARHVAALAGAGIAPVVSKVPTVALMSTGDEVVEPDTAELAPGKIRDTNRVLLRAMLADLGVPFVDLGIVGDDTEELRAAYVHAAEVGDVIVSTGGVSMGDFDFVKEILRDTGSVDFWRVAMQPGKPFAFGNVSGTPLFGLPGNPVSTFVSFEQFVRPAILSMMGATKVFRPRIAGIMGEDVQTNDEKEVFLRVLLAEDSNGSFVAVRSGGQGSNVLSTLAAAEAFAVIPVGVGSLSAGDPVTLEMFVWAENRGIDE